MSAPQRAPSAAVTDSRSAQRRPLGLFGWFADVLLFLVLLALGVSPVAAHLGAFSAVFLAAASRSASAGPAARCGRSASAARLVAVLLGTLALRGGVFGLFWQLWGWQPRWALLPAAAFSWSVATPAWRFARRARRWQLCGDPESRRLAVALISSAFLLRLLYMGQVELLPEETYYWNYGQHLDLSYLDHPPMVAWLIRLGTAIFGSDPFGVRAGAFGAAIVSATFSYRLTRNLWGADAARVALVLTQVLPFLFLTGLLMTPDAPLAACWAGTLYFLERALLAGHARAWLAAGVCLGLGLISKYTVGLLVPAALLFMLLDEAARRWLLRWQPYAAGLIAAALFTPVLVWNARHEWASFTFQTARRLAEAPRFSLHRLVLSALGLLTPTGVATLSLPARGGADSPAAAGGESRARWFLGLCIGVPLSVFVLFSLRHDVKVDWTGALWLAAVPLMARTVLQLDAASMRTAPWRGLAAFVARGWGPTAIVCLLLYGASLHYLALGLPGLGYSSHMELVPVGWEDLGRQIEARASELSREQGQTPLVIGMDRYAIASELAFYAADQPLAVATRTSEHPFGRAGLMYERWFPVQTLNGRTLLLVGLQRSDVEDPALSACTERLDPVQTGALRRYGIPIHTYYYRVAEGFHADCSAQESRR